MNRAIELHDSEVTDIEAIDDDIVIAFSHVYIHESDGTPAIAPGIGLTSEARLRIRKGKLLSIVKEFPMVVSAGELTLGSQSYPNCLPVDINFSGEVHLTLSLYSHTDPMLGRIDVVGEGAVFELSGIAQQIDVFPGSDV